jgi:hypothetical protein
MKKLIALTGAAYSGKSTIAAELSEHGYVRKKFSQTLKNMLLQIPGVTEEMTEGSLKEVPQSLFGGKTPRYAMQSLGTEWGRDTIFNRIWLESWKRSISGMNNVVVEDLRFPNEAELIRELGGEIWRVTRPNHIGVGHSSETEMKLISPDLVIKNEGSLQDLQNMLGHLVVADPTGNNTWQGEDLYAPHPNGKR